MDHNSSQFLVAVLAGMQVPFVCSETDELGEDLVDSYLYQVHLHRWLEFKRLRQCLVRHTGYLQGGNQAIAVGKR